MLFANYLPPSLVEFMTVGADADDFNVGTKPKLAVGGNMVVKLSKRDKRASSWAKCVRNTVRLKIVGREYTCTRVRAVVDHGQMVQV